VSELGRRRRQDRRRRVRKETETDNVGRAGDVRTADDAVEVSRVHKMSEKKVVKFF
jgi:hypothetical protein